MTQKDPQDLLKKYRLGTLTDEERAILESWYLQQAHIKPDFNISDKELEEDLSSIYKSFPIQKAVVRPLFSNKFFKISLAAASIALIALVGVFDIARKDKRLVGRSQRIHYEDVKPGGKKAVLILADNTRIVLDDASLGDIARETGITINKTAKGQLIYTVDNKKIQGNAKTQFNTISTPAGGEYQVKLSDGTVVWLNSMSSIRFPTAFNENERRVEISGEAYFEVAKKTGVPFRVLSGKHITEVLGTHFNVSAYPDDGAMRTTLLEGSVKVYLEDGTDSRVLKPGYQATIFKNAAHFEVSKADLEEAVAWKEGYFIFSDEDLKTIMKEIGRWYDIEVEYQNVNENLRFGGAVSRSKNLSEVLNLLELTDNVKFKVEGRRVIVMR